MEASDQDSPNHSTTLTVTRSGPGIRSIREALDEAHPRLCRGESVKIVISPGIYREAVVGLDWRQGKASETPLLIQGKGVVRWTGADLFPEKGWRKEGELWVHDWPHRWGNFAYSWSAPGLIGHRSEVVFHRGRPLRPRILERYEVEGMVQDPDRPGEISYRYLEALNPAKALKPGEFGVFERPENRPRLVVRLSEGDRPKQLEVSVRPCLLDLSGKNNVTLKGVTFERAANSDRNLGAQNPVTFGSSKDIASRHVLIENCRFLWNSMAGLSIWGDDWKIRHSEFSYNGGSGIASGPCSQVVWENNITNFNVWRLWMGGEKGYYTGGFKMHEAEGHTIRKHLAVGNLTMGAWWDVHCRDVDIRDLTAIDNGANFQFELCGGPLVADRVFLAGGGSEDGQFRIWEHGETTISNSIAIATKSRAIYNLRWFGRDDPHSRMHKITAGLNRVENCLFVGSPTTESYGLFDDIRAAPWREGEPMRYQGLGNTFWVPGLTGIHQAWMKDVERSGELAERAWPVEDWQKAPNWAEQSPRHADPCFRDPSRHDFRIGRASPLYSERSRWPEVKLSAKLLAEWAWFREWCAGW